MTSVRYRGVIASGEHVELAAVPQDFAAVHGQVLGSDPIGVQRREREVTEEGQDALFDALLV
jgi:hypothetical protein